MRKIKKIIKDKFSKVIPFNNYIYNGEILKEKVVLISGGTSGIGLAMTMTFLLNGANVIITGRNQDKITKVISQIHDKSENKYSNKLYGFCLDISNPQKISEQFDNITSKISPMKIDVLVNNAGILCGESIGNTKIEDFEKCVSTNLEGTYFLTECIFNYMKKNKIKGNILNVLSSSSNRPAVNPYAISKWGLKGLTLGLAKKFIKYGIVVNGIAPGPTATSMLLGDFDDKNIYLPTSPQKRYATPEEIANWSMFLISDMGRMIVGDIINISGGAGIITFDDIKY